VEEMWEIMDVGDTAGICKNKKRYNKNTMAQISAQEFSCEDWEFNRENGIPIRPDVIENKKVNTLFGVPLISNESVPEGTIYFLSSNMLLDEPHHNPFPAFLKDGV
jgi:hypothetical protein